MNLIDSIKTLESLNELNISDKILAGLLVAFIGMSITILVLVILWFIISVISGVNRSLENKNKNIELEQFGKEVKLLEEKNESVEENSVSSEVIAAITCVLHESLKHSNFKLRYVARKTEQNASWRKAEDGKIWK